MGISSALGSSALLPAGLGFRNKVINGVMVVAQRGTAAVTGSASAQYPVDRFVVYNGTGTVTFQQSSVAPTGFSNSIVATVTSTGSYSTSGYTEIGHNIEGYNVADLAWGTAGAKPIVLSFWCRSSVTGSYNVAFQNGVQNRSYVATFTVNAANTWEYKTIYVNGDTSGTWTTDNTAGLKIWFNLGMGTNYDTTGNVWGAGNLGSTSGAVDFAANSGATFYLTGVQLEQNYQPTPFEQRPYGIELQLCQRYYYAPQNAGGAGADGAIIGGMGYNYSTTSALQPVTLPVPMRTQPAIAAQSTLEWATVDGLAVGPSVGIFTSLSGNHYIALDLTGMTGKTAQMAGWLRFATATTGSFAVQAEL